MTEDKVIGLVTAELPFKLQVRTGNYLMNVQDRRIPVRVLSNHVWALGFKAQPDTPHRWIYANPDHSILVPGTPEPWTPEEVGYPTAPRSLEEWKAELGLDKVFIVPAGAIVQFTFLVRNVTPDHTSWLEAERMPDVALVVINDFLTRYRAAVGFRPEAGRVGPISEFELLELSVQLFEGLTPRSPLIRYGHGMPGPRFSRPLSEPHPMVEARLDHFLSAGLVPVPVRKSFDAYSALYRHRYDEALLGFWEAFELAVKWAEQALGISPKPGHLLERRASDAVNAAGRPPLTTDMLASLANARKLRNKVVHGEEQLPATVSGFPGLGFKAVDDAFSAIAVPLADILDILDGIVRRGSTENTTDSPMATDDA